MRLRDEVLIGRREDHGKRDGLDLAGAAEPHLVVQTLEQLRRELQVLEGRRGFVHGAARRHLGSNSKSPNQPTDIETGMASEGKA